MADRETILRHLETSVDVDEWAVIGVKEEFEKLEKIEKIVDDCTMNYQSIAEIREVLEQE